MRRVLSVLAVTAALVGLAACGGDDGDDSASATTTAVATSPTTQATPTYTGDPNSEFCSVARANLDRLREIGASLAGGGDLDQLLRDAAPTVRQAVALAPAEIKGDVTVLADGFDKLLASLSTGEADTSVVLDPKFSQAAGNLTAYGRQVCGITS